MAEEDVIRRILPHNLEAEQALIGSMILDSQVINQVAASVKAEDFYDKKYGLLFKALVDLEEEGKKIDTVTIGEKIRQENGVDGIVSPELIRQVMKNTITSVHYMEYARIVYEKSVLRRMIRVTDEISKNCYLDEKNLDDIMSDAEKLIYDIVQRRSTNDSEDIKNIMLKVVSQIEAASKTKGVVTGISTGFRDLDYKTAGLQNSDLVLIAARPSMGKTAFALNIAEYAAIKHNVSTVIFSLEMSPEALGKRILAMNSKVDSQKMRTGKLEDAEWDKVIDSVGIISSSNLIIDGKPGMSVSEVRSKCRKLKLEKNIGLVMIDYLQLLTTGKRVESRQLEISEISRALKAIAREIDAPVIALSQLSREVEKRENKRPMLSDLRDSGAIEQDADVVMFLYRDEYYNKESQDAGITEVIIGKQRNGPVGTVKLGWQSQFTKFVNIERE